MVEDVRTRCHYQGGNGADQRNRYAARMKTRADNHVGALLKDWRKRRKLSQLDLAAEAETSTRHLSFLETGRAAPSREMLIRLAESLGLPLRERNRLMRPAGYAPLYAERPLDAPEMARVRSAMDAVLAGHMPFPALAVDRHWNLVAANDAIPPLLAGIDAQLLTPPVNVLRLSLHPDGLSTRIINLAEWRHHLLERLRHQAEVTGDGVLFDLHAELRSYPVPFATRPMQHRNAVAVPLELRDPASGNVLRLISTTTVFGTATDVTLSELTLECFYPADDETRFTLLAGLKGSRN